LTDTNKINIYILHMLSLTNFRYQCGP